MTNRWEFTEVRYINIAPRLPLLNLRIELVHVSQILLTVVQEVILLPPQIEKAIIVSKHLVESLD